MAEEFVSKELFGEFVKRMDERFDHIQKDMTSGFAHVNQIAEQRYDSINQRLADADKAREQNMVHVNQRFDDMNHRFDDMNRSMMQGFENLEKRFDDQRRIVVLMLSAILTAVIGAALAGVGAAAKYLFFSS